MGKFTKPLLMEVTRGRNKDGEPITDTIAPGAIPAGLTVPLIRGMNMKDLIGTVQTLEDGRVTGYTHEDAAPTELRPAGTVEAFETINDGSVETFRDDDGKMQARFVTPKNSGRRITRFRLAAVSVGHD